MRLLHAEYLKLSRRKLYPVMVAILVVFVLMAAFFLILFGQIAPDLARDVPIVRKPQAFTLGVQQVVSQTWFPMLLAAVAVGGELGGTVWATSLTREPSVLRHVASRLLVLTAAGWLAFAVATSAWAVFAHFFATGRGGLDLAEWLGFGWRTVLIVLAWTSLGLGAVAALRSVGPAIGVVLGFSFLEAILALWEPYENISATAASTGLFGSLIEGFFSAFIPGADMSVGHATLVLLGWTAFGFLLTWWGLRRRDA